VTRPLTKAERNRLFDRKPTAWLRLLLRDVIERESEHAERFERMKVPPNAGEHRDIVNLSLVGALLHFARVGEPLPDSTLPQPDAEGQAIHAEWRALLDRFDVTQEAKAPGGSQLTQAGSPREVKRAG
jgi:hypothetical protein